MSSISPQPEGVPKPTRLERVLAAAVLGIGLYVAVSMARLVVVGYAPVPFWDQWLELPGDDRLAHPLARHNEHIILFSRVVFTLDDVLASGRNVLNLATTFVIALAHALLLGSIAARRARDRATEAAFAFGAPLALMMSAAQWENFAWGFQHQFVAVFAFGTGAFAALALFGCGRRSLVAASLLGALATVTLSCGVLVPLLLVALSVAIRRPRAQIAWLATLATVLVALYLRGYEPPGHHTRPSDALHRPLEILRYVAVYLGAPCASDGPTVRTAALAGGALILVHVMLLVQTVRRRDDAPREAWVFLAASLLVLGTAFLTALGRLDFGVEQALSSRYATPASIMWSSTLLHVLVWWRARGARARLTSRVAVLGITVLSLLAHRHARHIPADRATMLRLGETALLANVIDEQALSGLFVDTALVRRGSARLRARRLSIFADPWVSWLGAPLAERTRRSNRGCAGEIEDVIGLAQDTNAGRQVTGWAYLPSEKTRPRRVVVTDEQGVVVGFAYTGTPRPDVLRAHPEVVDVRVGFRGHIRGTEATQLVAHVLERNAHTCPLKSARH